LSDVVAGTETNGEPNDFLEATKDKAQQVLDAEEGEPTYRAGIELMGLAMSELRPSPIDNYVPELPSAIHLIWGALTDEWDAPGRASAEQDAAAVQHMKQAATEWLSVADSLDERSAYLDRWVYEECGYERKPSK
jgi:hypothetical protein